MNRWSGVVLAVVWLVAGLAAAHAGEVLVAPVEGVIGPAAAGFMVDAIDRAEARGCACIVFELDTPGGLDESMRAIIKRIMSAKIPVVVYVAPSGSRAASAGAFITVAAHVAAMAPGTAIGAAHPVSVMPLGQIDTNMERKVTNDAAAYIRSMAEKRGRNIVWVESAVRESVSLSETEALTQKVVDVIAPSTVALLELIDGRTVTVGQDPWVLHTKGATLVRTEMNWRDRLLTTIANPNLAYLLFMIGLLGLYFELSTPGAILPGVIGSICLILAFFAFQILPVSYAGVGLIVLAVVLFVVDVKAATHGVLTVGGLIAMFMGSILLFNSPDPALRASLQVLIPVVLVVALFFVIGVVLSARMIGRKSVSGAQGLVGQTGDARTAITRAGGTAFVAGAHWNASADADIAAGKRVRVVAVEGMALRVEAIEPTP